jgi:putative sigma-54 modulation protein
MNVEYTGRGTTVGAREKRLADQELARIDTMLMGRVVAAHVILTEEKYRQIAEITLQTRFDTFVARCESTEMLVAVHDAIKKIEQQVLKHKERRMTIQRQAKPASAEPLIEVRAV